MSDKHSAAESGEQKWLHSKVIRWGAATIVLPPFALVYLWLMTQLDERLNPSPHPRLIAAIHYGGKLLGLLLQPAPVIAGLLLIALLLLHERVTGFRLEKNALLVTLNSSAKDLGLPLSKNSEGENKP